MVDNEIIKGYCKKKLCPPAQEIINRQKAEIERLREENIILCQKRANIFEIVKSYDRGRAEAIKEFAERLKEIGTKVEGRKGFEGVYVMANNLQIDNLVKEMVGEKHG